MKLRFDPDQPHQREAIAAIVDVLAGHPFVPVSDAARHGDGIVANELRLPYDAILRGVQAVQRRAGLPVDRELSYIVGPGDASMRGSERFANLSVEMETGTGKTYAYMRTALELSRRVGFRKYVVVVPSVAVREGVLQAFDATREHFAALFPGLPYRFFAYDGARLSRVRAFAHGAEVDFMVVTIDAFNKASNLLRRPHDQFGGRVPLDVLRHVRPVLVLDEPQNLESPLSRRSLAELHPLLALRYSATHRRDYSLVHRLTPAQAHAAGLVKRVEVLPTTGEDPGEPRARAEARIRRTVALHVQRQAALRGRGVKVLSLFFVDRVDAWSGPDPWARRAFARAFTELQGGDPGLRGLDPEHVAAAYFAPRGGKDGATPIDSHTGASAADQAAYVLIMRDKARLLTFEEPVAFVVSHSALREGWDNPNVFQICALGASRSASRRRQEIGRGLRLCVDQQGVRVRDPEVDVLTVIADEDYEGFVAGLQAEDAREQPAASDRAPPPERSGAQRPSRPAPRASATFRAPTIPADLVGVVVASVAAATAGAQPYAGGADDRAPNLVDLVIMALLHRPRPTLVSRATVLEILQRLDPAALAASPHAMASRIADAIAAIVLGPA
jgi:restriction endonuclease